MIAFFHVSIFVVALVGISLALRHALNDVALIQPLHLFSSLFVAVNILICLWELSLYFYRDLIQHKFREHKKQLKRGQLPNPLFLFHDVSWSRAWGFEHWSEVWATYSLLDVCYSEPGSFGFNIDVGNGFSTLVPNLAFLLCMNGVPLPFGMSVRFFGFLSVLFFYQAAYGTVVYFFQYNLNRRWEEHDTAKFFYPLVVGTNGFWLVGPAACGYACWRMVQDDSLQVFLE